MDYEAMLMPVSFGAKPKADMPTPMTTKARNRRVAALREAADILKCLPGPGEAVHGLMSGRYDLSDLVEVLLGQLGPVKHMRIATLSFNRHNVRLLQSWTEASRVHELTLLCSLFFTEHNPELAEEFRQALPQAHFAAARNHCKVCCLDFAEGERRKLALEASANLRTNSNREQFALIDDPALHDWHAAWIDDEVRKHGGPAQ